MKKSIMTRMVGHSNLRTVQPDFIPHVLGEGEMGAVLDMWLSDSKTGLMIPGSRRIQRSESYVSNYLKILFAQMKQQSNVNPLGVPVQVGGITLTTVIPSPENYDTATNINWFASIITTPADCILTHIVCMGGNGGGIGGAYNLASIRAVAAGVPTGPDLALYKMGNHDYWGNGVYYGPPLVLPAGTYAICVRRDTAVSDIHFDYAAGVAASASSGDSGVTWAGGTRNYYVALFGFLGSAENDVDLSAVDTSDAYRMLETCPDGNNWASGVSIALDVLAGAGTVTYGIRAGTGNTPATIDDYALETPIAEGTGAGQLSHGGVTFGIPAADATVSQFTITRNLANGSGGAIIVKEVGLYCRCYSYDIGDYAGGTYPFIYSGGSRQTRYFAIIRDVLAVPKSIPDGQTLTINYRPQVTL